MSDTNEPSVSLADEEEVRRLLEQAGPRAEIPPETLAEIKTAFRSAWRDEVQRRQARRFLRVDRRFLALAASIVAALGIGWWLWSLRPSAGPGLAAHVESVAGVVESQGSRLAGGEEILAGAEIETAAAPAGLAALRLAGGPSLRLDAGTRVRLASASVVELDRGAVYLDSVQHAVVIRTPLGIVREVGTQFEVRLLGRGTALRVRVREGAVRIEEGTATYPAEAGTELTLHAGGAVTRRPLAGHGSSWSWVLDAAPPLEIEGLTLHQLLERVSRETGWTIRYADEDLAASAGSIVIHGKVGQLRPDQVLDVVLPGAGLSQQVVDGVVIVRSVEEP